MTQTSNRFYDGFARLMNDAAGVAQGVRREATSLFRSQAERIVGDMELVRREDFDAVKEMASLAREENIRLQARIDALEARLSAMGGAAAPASSATAADAGTKRSAPGARRGPTKAPPADSAV
jgi:BMFP domain-containing protein YqiC